MCERVCERQGREVRVESVRGSSRVGGGEEYGECVSVCVSVRVESVRVAVEKSTASV